MPSSTSMRITNDAALPKRNSSRATLAPSNVACRPVPSFNGVRVTEVYIRSGRVPR